MSTPPEDTSSQLEPGTNEWQSSLVPRRDATHMSRTLVAQKVPVG
jgi:hypothetical protein